MTSLVPKKLSTRENCAAIVAVGTEVCAGDIANTNGAWLANELTQIGFRVTIHLVVEDDRTDIANALDIASKSSAHIFVIGGLGPTTDDFTRDVIASWSGKPLTFSPESWNRVQERFARLGRPTPPSNKQQCFFPLSSDIYPNANGTADGFTCTAVSTKLWVLPGPPTELKGIWHDHFLSILKGVVPSEARLHLRTWHCLGQGESFLAEIAEKCLEGSGLERGYRARFPYVDIKVWVQAPLMEEASPWLSRLETALEKWLIGADQFDLAADFAAKLKGKNHIRVVDHITAGSFFARTAPDLRRGGIDVESFCYTPHLCNEADLERAASTAPICPKDFDAIFHLHGLATDGSWVISAATGAGQTFSGKFQTHLRGREWENRNQIYIAEQALHLWNQWLKSKIL
jgi:nicotinamide-nucleotide amidase